VRAQIEMGESSSHGKLLEKRGRDLSDARVIRAPKAGDSSHGAIVETTNGDGG
jgi:hypothetical protein